MVTSIYAAILGLFFVVLSIRTIRTRRIYRIALGYGEAPELVRQARVHGNFAEYVPLSLLLLYFLELSAAPDALLHALGLILLFGRGMHAYGVSQIDEDYRFRVIGMSATFAVIVTTSLAILVYRLI